jgi:hypothetical protein
MFPMQKLIVQSAAAVQLAPTPHFGQAPPPQSVSVSSPSTMPFVQLGPASPPSGTPPSAPPVFAPPAPPAPPAEASVPPVPVFPPAAWSSPTW